MNYKLIEKLAKLANNNPNEHEANMAARKVCKLLAEANFKFNESEIVSMGTSPSSSSIYDNFRDMMNNIRKEQEQQFYGNPFKTGQYQSPFNEHTQKTRTEPPPNTYYPDDKKYYKRRAERGFGNEIRNLKCKKCSNVKPTIFVGLPELFECNECQWKEYL